MRKKALRKKEKDRHKIILSLRRQNNLKEIITPTGETVYLNFMKHLLHKKVYKNDVYNRELRRFGNNAMKNINRMKRGNENET